MGCSNSRVTTDQIEIISRIQLERNQYNTRHEKFEFLCQDIMPDLRKVLDPTDKTAISKCLDHIKTQKGLGGLTESELLECITDFIGQIYIEENKLIDVYDVYEYAFNMAQEVNLLGKNSSSYDFAKILIENFSRIFPRSQKGTVLSLYEGDCEINILQAMITNFKFNLSFQLEILNLVANNFLLINYSLCQSLADVIESDKNLQTVLIHVDDDDDKLISQEMLINLNFICNSIRRSISIKFFFMQTLKDSMFSLTPEIEKCILELIRKDLLYGLYLSKFGLSDSFMIELGKSLVNCKNLKLILIESKTSNINLLDDLIIHGLGRNRSVQVAIISGFNIGDNKANEYKQIQKHNEVLKIFEYLKEIV